MVLVRLQYNANAFLQDIQREQWRGFSGGYKEISLEKYMHSKQLCDLLFYHAVNATFKNIIALHI